VVAVGVEVFHPLEPGLAQLAEALLVRDLVVGRRPNGKVSRLVLEDDQSAARSEIAAKTPKVRDPILEVMVGVDDEDPVDAMGRQVGIGVGGQHRNDVVDIFTAEMLAKGVELARLHIDRVDDPLREVATQWQREHARADAEIGDHHGSRDAQRADHALWIQLPDPFVTLQTFDVVSDVRRPVPVAVRTLRRYGTRTAAHPDEGRDEDLAEEA
jgi:hypothetical protein